MDYYMLQTVSGLATHANFPVLTRVWKAYHLRGLVFHGLGEHRYVTLISSVD